MSDVVSLWHKQIIDDPNKTVVREVEGLNNMCGGKIRAAEINSMIRGERNVNVCHQQTMLLKTLIPSLVKAGLKDAENMRFKTLQELIKEITPIDRGCKDD